MPGPNSARQELEWMRAALTEGRYFTHEPHFGMRCRQRGFSLADAENALLCATSCRPYLDRQPTQGGTNWRVTGPDLDGDAMTLGIEMFRDEDGRWILLITLF